MFHTQLHFLRGISITLNIGPVDPAALETLKGQLMSVFTAAIADANAAFDLALERVRADVDDLNAQVADLKIRVADGTATAEDLDALRQLTGRINALDPTKPEVLPDVEVTETTAPADA